RTTQSPSFPPPPAIPASIPTDLDGDIRLSSSIGICVRLLDRPRTIAANDLVHAVSVTRNLLPDLLPPPEWSRLWGFGICYPRIGMHSISLRSLLAHGGTLISSDMVTCEGAPRRNFISIRCPFAFGADRIALCIGQIRPWRLWQLGLVWGL
ncbi:hypothetical protein BHE74_00001621, partial [Ensete ventricosum]